MQKIGQIVIGNDGANHYTRTRPGVKCKIVDIDKPWIYVSPLTPSEYADDIYSVNPADFDICVDVEDKYKEFKPTKELMQDILKCPEGKVIYIKDDEDSPYTIKEDAVYDNDDYDIDFISFLNYLDGSEYRVDDYCVEMTLEEVCKALGKNIKIIKGESK